MEEEGDKYVTGPKGERRLKGVSVSVPVVTGTIASWLGKKATEFQSHKWTVYLRSATGEDLTHVFKKVTFALHPSFTNPDRDVEFPPYELTECGWGEFDITVRLHFHEDTAEPPIELFHRLRLYDDTGANNAKKPVVHEVYDEVVFWEPTEALHQRVAGHQARPAPPSQLAPFYTLFTPEVDYQRVQRARQRVAQIMAHAKAQLAAYEAEDGAA